MKYNILIILSVITLVITGCAGAEGNPTASPAPTETPPGIQTLAVMTHGSFAVTDEVITAFETANNIEVQFLSMGDTGTALNKAILSKGNPLGVLSVDNHLGRRVFTEKDEDLLASLADFAAIALENAQLYQQAQQELAERKLIRRRSRITRRSTSPTGTPAASSTCS